MSKARISREPSVETNAVAETVKPPFFDWLLEKVVFLAVCFTPFQLALTIKLGDSPLKISEILILLSILIFPLSTWVSRKPKGQAIIALFSIIFLISAIYNYIVTDTTLEKIAHGFTRSQTGDILFYTFFTIFALISWKIIGSLDRSTIEKALIIASWLCIIAVLFQAVGVATGNQSLVEALGFESQGRVEDRLVSTRNGPFKEGQHLGFYAGSLLIICFYKKRWLACLGLSYCIYYSQSTTAILGILAALAVVIALRLNVYTLFAISISSVATFIGFISSSALREFVYIQLAKLGIPSVGGLGERYTVSLDVRSVKTDIGWQIMGDHPILGVGPGRYSIWFFDYPDSLKMPYYYFRATHRAIAENIYAQIAAEVGLIGFIVFLIFLLYLLIRNLSEKNTGLLALSAFAFIGISTQSMLTFLPIWTIFALLASSEYGNYQKESRRVDA